MLLCKSVFCLPVLLPNPPRQKPFVTSSSSLQLNCKSGVSLCLTDFLWKRFAFFFLHDHASIYMQNLSCDVPSCRIQRQIFHQLCDFLCFAHATCSISNSLQMSCQERFGFNEEQGLWQHDHLQASNAEYLATSILCLQFGFWRVRHSWWVVKSSCAST